MNVEIKGLCYIASPYTKYSEGIDQAFIAVAHLCGRLLRNGIVPFSPICHSHPIAIYGELDPLDHSIWLPADKPMMDACDVLIVAHLPGWQESYGVAEEIKIFEAAGKPIFDLDPKTLVMTPRRGPFTYEPTLAHHKDRSEHAGTSEGKSA